MDWQQYFYFIGTTLFLPIWILLFLKKESRKDMLITGIALGLGAFIIEHLYAKIDYWTPVLYSQNFHLKIFIMVLFLGGLVQNYMKLFLGKEIH